MFFALLAHEGTVMDFTTAEWGLLYTMYEAHTEQLRQDVVRVNRELGSPNPEATKFDKEMLSKSDFEASLKTPADMEVAQQWICRIIRDRENEFSVDFLQQLEQLQER